VKLNRPSSATTCSLRCRRRSAPVAVLDRTKEPCAIGTPLDQDVLTALLEGAADEHIRVIGDRYGLGSKD